MTLHAYDVDAYQAPRGRTGSAATDRTTSKGSTRSAPRRRSLRRGVAVTVATLGLAAGLLAHPAGASADPAPQTVEQAKQQVAQLQQEAEAADQQYRTLKQQLKERKADLKEKKAELEERTAKVEKTRQRLSKVALAQFQNRSLDARTRLFLTEDTTGFLNQMATVEKVSENQNAVLQNFQSEQAKLADLKRSIKADIATLQEEEQRLDDLRKKAEQKVEKAENLVDELTAEERRLIEEEKARQEAAARKAAEEAEESFAIDQVDADGNVTLASDDDGGDSSGDDGSSDSSNDDDSSSSQNSSSQNSSSSSTSSSSSSSSSSKGMQALAFAKAQLGKPYAYGASGPSSYDCSGLTLAAWQSAGVQLSRTSQTQINDGTPVSRSELQPGDLVFFYGSSPSHVAIYAGNGSIIHAPNSGGVVEYSKIEYMPYSGAVRPG